MGRRSQVLRQETANLRSVVKFHPPPPPPLGPATRGCVFFIFASHLKKSGQVILGMRLPQSFYRRLVILRHHLGCSKSGAVLRPDPLVPCPVGGPMTGPMTDRAAGACLGILTQSDRSARSGTNGGIRARPDGGIRPRADGCPRARANTSACSATAPGPGSRATTSPGTSTPTSATTAPSPSGTSAAATAARSRKWRGRHKEGQQYTSDEHQSFHDPVPFRFEMKMHGVESNRWVLILPNP